MRKTAVMQCPEHVFCEQAITRNVVHPFCLRQYASFQARPARRGFRYRFALQLFFISVRCVWNEAVILLGS